MNWKETYCATLPLIFCQVIPGLFERREAAGRETALHFLAWRSRCCSVFRALFGCWPLTEIRQFIAATGVQKASENDSVAGIRGAPAKKRQEVLAEEWRGLFPSLALMPNEGTWVHRGNPRRRELIPPGGISRHVKYVSWYLCRATLNGFTYRNSQWDGDSLQCLPDFTLR